MCYFGLLLAALLICTRMQLRYWQNTFTLFGHTIEVTENNYIIHNYYASTLAKKGQLKEAATHLEKALRINPRYSEAQCNLAHTLLAQGKNQSALDHYYKILEFKPDEVDILNNLAWILATSEDTKIQNPSDAVKYAERACELTEYSRPGFLDTLAAAYAAAGRLPEAIETAEKAVKLATSAGKKVLAQEIQKHLELYKAGRPCRESPSSVQENVGQ